MDGQHRIDVAVVGGGLTGLAAATYLARAGQRVVVLERSQRLGGRAITRSSEGFSFNLGPHALYTQGAGVAVLRELGGPIDGGRFRMGAYPPRTAALRRFPGGPLHVLSERLSVLQSALPALARMNPAPLQHTSVRDWLDAATPDEHTWQVVLAFVRLISYAHEPSRQSAGAVIEQLRVTAGGVLYLHGGWQTLVDALSMTALAAGVEIRAASPVAAISPAAAGWQVRGDDEEWITARSVIIAAAPAVAARLVAGEGGKALSRWAREALPVRAACLTVGLSELPRPPALFDLGIERPLYLSVHSHWAELAPRGGATIHVARYLAHSEPPDPDADRLELEAFLDLVQPGWRGLVVRQQFLPRMVVANGLATAEMGGNDGRPGPAVPGAPGLYVAGDWVGDTGMLVDAALASARRAASLIAESARHDSAA